MKKGQILEGTVEKVVFPNKGIVTVDDKKVILKNAVPGQKVRFSVKKVRKGKGEGSMLEVLEKSPLELDEANCLHFGSCGGCTYQSLPYEEQLRLKEAQVLELLEVVAPDAKEIFEGIKPSPDQFGYRNKMEFTFGDEFKDGPLSLGMHKRNSFYDIVTVEHCKIIDEDYRKILMGTLEFFRKEQATFYHRLRHTGYLRHLLVRKAVKTGEILIDLVTTTQKTGLDAASVSSESSGAVADLSQTGETKDLTQIKDLFQAKEIRSVSKNEKSECLCKEKKVLEAWKDCLLSLKLDGKIVGILHTRNDSVADAVKNEGTDVLYGQDGIYEELLGLKFKISTFSFFQTNSLGAEVLYQTAREYIGDTLDEQAQKTVYDLYSGTGTIAQILAPAAKRVIGVEIVEEAVEAARENAALNGLSNCEFIAGDVLKVLDKIEERPDFIVLDPPRDGIHPKALEKIIRYGVDKMIYISCKPTSLQRDLEVLQARGYRAERICCVDMFPGTANIETVCLLSNRKSKPDTHVDLTLDMKDYYRIKDQEKQSNK